MRSDPFRGGDPVGHPIETDEPDRDTRTPHRLTTYSPAGSGVPRYVGPLPPRPGPLRRVVRWLGRLIGRT